jgi:hypothetical protein
VWCGQSVRVVDVMALLVERGVLLESARGPIPNVAELVAGEPEVDPGGAGPTSGCRTFGAERFANLSVKPSSSPV